MVCVLCIVCELNVISWRNWCVLGCWSLFRWRMCGWWCFGLVWNFSSGCLCCCCGCCLLWSSGWVVFCRLCCGCCMCSCCDMDSCMCLLWMVVWLGCWGLCFFCCWLFFWIVLCNFGVCCWRNWVVVFWVLVGCWLWVVCFGMWLCCLVGWLCVWCSWLICFLDSGIWWCCCVIVGCFVWFLCWWLVGVVCIWICWWGWSCWWVVLVLLSLMEFWMVWWWMNVWWIWLGLLGRSLWCIWVIMVGVVFCYVVLNVFVWCFCLWNVCWCVIVGDWIFWLLSWLFCDVVVGILVCLVFMLCLLWWWV